VNRTELVERIKAAAAVVAEAGLTESLQPAAFEAAFAALGNTRPIERPASHSERTGRVPGDANPIARIASTLGLPIEVVDDVFHVDGDRLGLGVASSRIARAKTAGTKQLALLVAVGRQVGGFDEEWTSSAEIRRVCVEYGRFDSNNFATTLTEMDEWFQFRGQRQQREVRVKRPGLEEGSRLIRGLAGIDRDEGD
jgi:hypothetical protein